MANSLDIAFLMKLLEYLCTLIRSVNSWVASRRQAIDCTNNSQFAVEYMSVIVGNDNVLCHGFYKAFHMWNR